MKSYDGKFRQLKENYLIANDDPDVKDYFIQARHAAKKSHDPSTKVGCVIVHASTGQVISIGRNGPPMNLEDDKHYMVDREIKHQMVLHAEDNALLFAGDRFRENNHYHIYTYPFMPCPKCMAKIIQHAEYYNFNATIHAPVNLSPREEAYEKSFDLTIDLVDNMKYKRLDIVLYELPSWEI